MHKLLTLGLASLFVVVTGCQDTNTTEAGRLLDQKALGVAFRSASR